MVLEKRVLRSLDEDVSLRSSFQFDYTHIWRDMTMTNILFVEDEKHVDDLFSDDYNSDMAVGVVTQRNLRM